MRKIALVVDDNSYARTFIGDVLAEVGYDVRKVADGQEALQICEPIIDLLVTDLSLPKVGGLQLLQAAKEGRFGPDTLCVVCSPLTAVESVARRLSDFSSVALVSKPCNGPQLIDAIKLARMRASTSRRRSELIAV